VNINLRGPTRHGHRTRSSHVSAEEDDFRGPFLWPKLWTRTRLVAISPLPSFEYEFLQVLTISSLVMCGDACALVWDGLMAFKFPSRLSEGNSKGHGVGSTTRALRSLVSLLFLINTQVVEGRPPAVDMGRCT